MYTSWFECFCQCPCILNDWMIRGLGGSHGAVIIGCIKVKKNDTLTTAIHSVEYLIGKKVGQKWINISGLCLIIKIIIFQILIYEWKNEKISTCHRGWHIQWIFSFQIHKLSLSSNVYFFCTFQTQEDDTYNNVTDVPGSYKRKILAILSAQGSERKNREFLGGSLKTKFQ